MKYLYFVILFFICTVCKSQTLAYYNTGDSGRWQCITFIIPAGDVKAAKMFYVSNTEPAIQPIKEVKEASGNGVNASYITIGTTSPQKYLLVAPNNAKFLILSDERQMTQTVFNLDSKMMNPDVKQSLLPSSETIMKLLALGAKILL